MTLFNIQNQIAVKLLAVVTMLMMVASLVPASVFAQAEGRELEESTSETLKIVADSEQGGDKKAEKDKSKPENQEGQNVVQQIIQNVSNILNGESDRKITVCHATGDGNYKVIEPNINSLKNGHANSGINSGDIVPPTPGTSFVDGQNWDAAGQAIYNNKCAVPYEETEDLLTITQSTVNLLTNPTGTGWYFESTAPFTAPFVFNTAAAKIGTGSLFVGPVGAVPQNKFIGAYQNITPVKNIKSFAYDFKIASNTAADENEFYLNVYANFGSSSPSKFYDCRYDVVPSTGSLTNFTQVTFDANTVYPVTTRTGGSGVASPFACPTTLAGMEALSPGSVVRAFALNVGDTGVQDAGVSGHFDKVVIKTQDDTSYTKNTTTFDFEPAKKKDDIKVHIYKYLVNGTTSAQVPNDSSAPSFPMNAVWNAANGTGSGSYILGNTHGGAAFRYAADTSAMTAPADYTTSEVTVGDSVVLPADAKCEVGKYRLVGYKQGDSIGAAESATLTTTAPVYTDITTDKYVIVVNEKCTDAKPVCAIGSNLMLNGSFENTPIVTANGGQWQIFAGGILNWLATLSSGLEVWNTFNGTGNDVASDGVQNVELDGDDATNIAQDVATIPGATYELKFDYSARAATALADSKMDAMINGVSALSVNTDGSAATGNVWEPKTTTFVAVGTSTKISFEDKGVANADGGFGPLLDNVSLCLVKKPVPEPVCTLTIKSDATDYVVEKNVMAQTLSFIHSSWVTAIGTSTAAWIWGDNPVVNPLVNETQTFKKSFNWTGGTVTGATLKLASDNSHEVKLGAYTNGNPGEFNYGAVTSYDVATSVVNGLNTLAIEVENFAQVNGTPTSNPAGLMYELTITGTGKSCGNVVPEVPVVKTATVTMCKEDTEGDALSGWQLSLLGSKVGEVDVLPNGTTYSIPAVPTGSYVVKGSGTYVYRGTNLPADASYSTRLPGDVGYGSYPDQPWLNSSYWGAPGYLSLQINNVPHVWGNVFNPAHIYYAGLNQVATSAVNFKITDNGYGDNSGSLKVQIFNGRTGVTGKNGCTTFTDVPYGTYTAEELLQADWVNVSGLGPIVVDSKVETVTVVNRDTDEETDTYILDGYKYFCSENDDEGGYNDDTARDASNEYEDYYNCDKDDIVPGWTIYATNDDTNEVATTTTNEFGYYSFEVEGGKWTVSEGNDVRGEWEQVAAEINGEDYDDFTCTFEEMEDEVPSLLKQMTDYIGLTNSVDEEYYVNQCDFYNFFYDDEDPIPKTYTVTGVKWNDADGEGDKDDTEVRMSNWVVTATKGTSSVATTTDINGNYTLVLPYGNGTWVVSETQKSGWTQTGLYKNGTKVILGSEVSNSCSLNLGTEANSGTCDFGNKQNVVITPDPETPNNNRSGGGSGTRVKKPAPTGLVLGAATGTPACGMYLQDYMRMGNAASTTQVTKLQVFLNAVGITAPLTGIFDAATDAAVRAFQMQYKPEVLTPWYLAKLVPHENSTGWVYQLTRWKINNIVCPGSEAYPVLN